MGNYYIDNFIEYALTKRGRENLGLSLLLAGCVAGIVAIGRH
jgi:hypothetical protein